MNINCELKKSNGKYPCIMQSKNTIVLFFNETTGLILAGDKLPMNVGGAVYDVGQIWSNLISANDATFWVPYEQSITISPSK